MIWLLFFLAALAAGIVRYTVGPNDLLMILFIPALAVFLAWEWVRARSR